MSSKPRFFLVNAFATQPHGGNQAAVVLLGTTLADESMAAIARDFDLPMTAFLTLEADGGEPQYAIRWFTPRGTESKLCGHATLASAFVLFNEIHPTASTVHLAAPTAQLTANLQGERGQGARIALELPVSSVAAASDAATALTTDIAAAAGIEADDIVQVTLNGADEPIVELKATVPLKDLQVDVARLPPVFHVLFTQVIGPGKGGVEVRSRVFLPALGFEDPVTGSAHAQLTHYYLAGAGHERTTATLGAKPTSLDAYQVSERGGAMQCSLAGEGRARVVGQAWMTGSGVLELL